MEEFSIIYKILKTLRDSMDYPEFNHEAISPELLGISEEKWKKIIIMLVKNDYIEGVSLIPILGKEVGVKLKNPNITLKGLEYLEENSMMKKASNFAKGIIDVVF